MPTPAPTPAAHGMGPNPAASAATTGDVKGVRSGGSGAGIGGVGLTPAPSSAVSGVTTGDAEGVGYEGSGEVIGGMGPTPAPIPPARCTGSTRTLSPAALAATADGVEGVG